MKNSNGELSSKKPRQFDQRRVVCVAPVNIATVKYWGKADEEKMLPLNPSISVTLDTAQMCTETSVTAFRDKEGDDVIVLNGRIAKLTSRMCAVVSKMREVARNDGCELADWRLKIETKNNFPTAAGLASSASGLACLVFCLKNLFELPSDFSSVARFGSGSACRSMLGGFVQWSQIDNAEKSGAEQIAPADHWPDLRVLICVGSEGQKACGSTDGMQSSVRTSSLLAARVCDVVPARLKAMRDAIIARDFDSFAEVTMKESNQLHAICLDTFPPLTYLAPWSLGVMRLVHALNDEEGRCMAAYSCDAGAHVFLFVLEKDVPAVISALRANFSLRSDGDHRREVPVHGWDGEIVYGEAREKIGKFENDLTRIIYTKVGDGPVLVSSDDT